MTKDEIILANKEFLFPAVFHYYKQPLVVSHAKNQYVWDADGNRYLDFFGGIVTVSVGHCNDRVNAKVHKQIDTLQHVSTLFANEPQAALAKKTARCYTGNTEIVALRHSYHGRSATTMGLTGQGSWKLGPPQAGIVHAHNAYCYRCPFGLAYPDCGVKCAQDVEELIRSTTSGRVAGFIGEPIQGVGGFITPPREYFQIVESIVRNHGGVFIADEVQTAWGRTGGKWFGIEHWGVVPDIITSAKGLGNGSPIGLTVAKPAVADSVTGLTISTFGGNPVTATAAKAVIDFIEEENLLANCASTGAYLRAGLEDLKEKHPLIGEVRGMGLMQAIELVQDRRSKAPAPAETAQVLEAARENRLLIGKGGMFGNVIRISPPMNIARADVDQFLGLLDQSLAVCGAVAAGGVR
jgi:4-aminobutyrate aminotransferase